ncbi:phosphoribosylformylglycinamidine synthase subunit PurL [Rhodospirillum rubrum]|uniref:Phosphoribosylformylglycinamidine synthase subunit PurL n=1 Tax=Rhodospirillum rubrum (strain ATCC 11170 / ATH 1.1.1 / DSM 467 / LMG 4362 / NCIMB 8255 / S1) TaxID=269796 RepID=PURL_RHORT|nr:phosphoribosylformylglycinamidine synthase subunit PurL [Rhodospirillum rubrum]Q2RWI3.1 RecName: Full=Phosphoribosylformylglycinamidine synthase subunit PurL; Short=FGAM synthase; AltName: Full=Formylglycinamide ribonucleotide amidotransferase subunit II; Short=FGAR amidotransferase II; Short=FGAR-AT II; AltName: Full=Glutamine amidotransferase PurL; AltName: Full=Phosphoribosylformylglycinamidine synthase subunit II [Rhodospirillum rubrum ATCC 11170]ABC21512.1 Phosphoribosylformylglycinamidin
MSQSASTPATPITAKIVAEHGLTEAEYAKVLAIMGREPNLVELGIFSVMWSEHCSYKSSKKWLKTLPTTAPWVIQGPGENAGVIDIGDGLTAIFKMESHNHPSYIEPYQGAATGVGGILRDVFTMGARPVANLNALRFGDPSDPRTRHLISGVVAGIGGYGNCVGVPTVGGEVNFHASFNGNNLVNAMTVGVARADRIFYSAAAGIGNSVVYVGSKTGRDGIHGATMASAEFSEDSEEKRPTVQVGDPFTEKLLIEACLELMNTDAIVAIQDMGAAGLTSSCFEMASKGGMGVDLALDRVPMREEGMTPYELMLSESQERMLMVLKPGKEDMARALFEKWELDFAIIGTLTDSGRMVLTWHGEVVGDLPIDPLAAASPEYDRPWEPTPMAAAADLSGAEDTPWSEALLRLIGCPDVASRRWIWEQYDHLVMGNTLQRPGGDAAVIRLDEAPGKGLAMTTDCTPRYVHADPVEGGKQAVAEAWRNLTAVGARPLAITDNMNFGNPEKPRIMGQFVGACQGISEACLALDFPVVSGNVSLYNETNGQAILPTPTIGGVGVLDNVEASVSIALKAAGEAILVAGGFHGSTGAWLGQSLFLREILGREEGAPPPVDLAAERKVGDFVRGLILGASVTACHDLSDGGLLVALAEMAMAGDLGAELTLEGHPDNGRLFGEDQGRYLLTVAEGDRDAVVAAAEAAGVPLRVVGTTGGDALVVNGFVGPSVAALRKVHEEWLPTYMAG